MEFKKYFIRYAPERLVRNYPLEAMSRPEFASFVESRGGKVVSAEVILETQAARAWSKDRNIRRVTSYIKYRSETQEGRELLYRERLDEIAANKFDPNYIEERAKLILRGELTAEYRLRDLRERLPHVRMLSPFDIMSEGGIKEAQDDIKRYNITPYPYNQS